MNLQETVFMKKTGTAGWRCRAAGMAAFGIVLCANPAVVQAEEPEVYLMEDGAVSTAAAVTGNYEIDADWEKSERDSTQEEQVYYLADMLDAENTSTITCSYMDTNYTVLEYEQLRDMLSSKLIYSNVSAQISTSAVYTEAKDYLYIVTVDDSAQDYLDVYYYVVGNQRCFCVAVREYRAEAEARKADSKQTPQEAGKEIAEKFTWNAIG